MGVISRKIFPTCESMCVCCPALRPRSRHPVKRYKKLLAEIFPKSPLHRSTLWTDFLHESEELHDKRFYKTRVDFVLQCKRRFEVFR